MLYLIFGTSKDVIDKEIAKVAKSLPITKIDSFNFDPDLIRGEVESTSLFGGEESVIVLSEISEIDDHFDFIRLLSPALAQSSKIFFLIEKDLLKQDLEVFQKAGAEIKDLKEKKERDWGYSPFALQDAIGERNIKNIWVEYQRLRQNGIESEDLVHKIISKVRDMSAIMLGATAIDLGMKDFPYNKSKRDTKNWKAEDLKNFYEKIVSIYHESRMGLEDLDRALEKTLLSL